MKQTQRLLHFSILSFMFGFTPPGVADSAVNEAQNSIQQNKGRSGGGSSPSLDVDNHMEGHRRKGAAYSFDKEVQDRGATVQVVSPDAQEAPAPIVIPKKENDGVERLPTGHTPEERKAAVIHYFKKGNKEIDQTMIILFEKDISKRLEKKIRKRDDNRCIVCGSRKNVELDLARAQINGGQPVLSNMNCLCETCREIKTKIDKKFHGSLKAHGYRFGSL